MAKRTSGAPIETELVNACRDGNVDRVDRALAAGAPLELDRAGGLERPLFLAAVHGHAHLFRFLLGRGADVGRPTSTGVVPMFEAIAHDHVDIVGQCLDAGDSVERQDDSGQSPLMCAVGSAALRTVRLLLARGADADGTSQREPTLPGTAAIHHAGRMRPAAYAGTAARDIVLALRDAGADLARKDSHGQTLFHIASASEHVPARWLDWLIELGFSADEPDAWGHTPLWTAARANRVDRVAWLLAHGANPNARTTADSGLARAGVSVYEIALPEADLKLLALLREAGATTPGRPTRPERAVDPLQVGASVVHATFGPGEIVARHGEGAGLKLTVKFAGAERTLLARFVSPASGGEG